MGVGPGPSSGTFVLAPPSGPIGRAVTEDKRKGAPLPERGLGARLDRGFIEYGGVESSKLDIEHDFSLKSRAWPISASF